MPEFTLSTTRNEEMIDITAQVQGIVSKSGLKDGACIVFVPHTTAAVTINENYDPDVKTDIMLSLSRIVPKDAGYRHSEGNSAAHIKSSLIGTSEIVPLRAGKLLLGQWQGIMLCEFDGPRERRIIVELLSKQQNSTHPSVDGSGSLLCSKTADERNSECQKPFRTCKQRKHTKVNLNGGF